MKFTFYKPLAFILLFGMTFFPAKTKAQIHSYTNATNSAASAVAANANRSNLVRVNGGNVP